MGILVSWRFSPWERGLDCWTRCRQNSFYSTLDLCFFFFFFSLNISNVTNGGKWFSSYCWKWSEIIKHRFNKHTAQAPRFKLLFHIEKKIFSSSYVYIFCRRYDWSPLSFNCFSKCSGSKYLCFLYFISGFYVFFSTLFFNSCFICSFLISQENSIDLHKNIWLTG